MCQGPPRAKEKGNRWTESFCQADLLVHPLEMKVQGDAHRRGTQKDAA